MKEFNRESFSEFLSIFLQENGLQPRRFAEVIGCSEATVDRLLQKRTLPSDNMVNRARVVFQFDFEAYSKLSKTQQKVLCDQVGAAVGGSLGIAAIPFIISALGSGLSADGITSGLAALGGTMIGGIVVAAAIPVSVGMAGMAIGHGMRFVSTSQSRKRVDMDKRWEIILQN